MTSKEIIQRLIHHDAPQRIGYDFLDQTDFLLVESRSYINLPENPYTEWAEYPELRKIARNTLSYPIRKREKRGRMSSLFGIIQ